MTTPESEVFDPTTPAARLAELAASHPQFGIAIVNHPNAYPALIGWIAQHGDEASRAAAATRLGATATAPVAPPAPAVPRRPLGIATALRGWLDGALRVWRGETDRALATPGEVRAAGGAAWVLALGPAVVNAILIGLIPLVVVAGVFESVRRALGGFGAFLPGVPGGVLAAAFFIGFGFSLLYVALRVLGLLALGRLRRTPITALGALETISVGAGAATPLAFLAFLFSFLAYAGEGGAVTAGVFYVLFGVVSILVVEGLGLTWLRERLGGTVPVGPNAILGGLAWFLAYGGAFGCLVAALSGAGGSTY